MPKEIVSTDDAPKGLAGYSQAVKANGLVFVSGQGPFDPATGDVVGETIQEQTRQCLRNVEAILKAAGSSIDSVVQATFILDDESDFPGMNEEWSRWFLDQPPARQGAQLPIRPKGMRISIAAIATTS
jgi:2-iminobutanoate/2-iminopropanoate deaminase